MVTQLDLVNNQLEAIPNEIKKLTKLKILNLEGNEKLGGLARNYEHRTDIITAFQLDE